MRTALCYWTVKMAWGIFTRPTVENATRLLNNLFTPRWLSSWLLAKLQFFIFLFGFWGTEFSHGFLPPSVLGKPQKASMSGLDINACGFFEGASERVTWLKLQWRKNNKGSIETQEWFWFYYITCKQGVIMDSVFLVTKSHCWGLRCLSLCERL